MAPIHPKPVDTVFAYVQTTLSHPSYRENLLEDTAGLLRPLFRMGLGGEKQPISALSICSSLLPSLSADVRPS